MVRHCYCSSKVKDMIFFCVTMRYDVRKKFRKLHFVKHFLQNERKKGAQHFLFLHTKTVSRELQKNSWTLLINEHLYLISTSWTRGICQARTNHPVERPTCKV